MNHYSIIEWVHVNRIKMLCTLSIEIIHVRCWGCAEKMRSMQFLTKFLWEVSRYTLIIKTKIYSSFCCTSCERDGCIVEWAQHKLLIAVEYFAGTFPLEFRFCEKCMVHEVCDGNGRQETAKFIPITINSKMSESQQPPQSGKVCFA